MKNILSKRSSLAVNIIGVILILLLVFALVMSALGYASFTKSFEEEYSDSTFHIASTAAKLVNGDRLDIYLAGWETEEYARTKNVLDAYCKNMGVSLIYVIWVDQSDYGSFVSVFNSVNNDVDNSEYVEWELGHWRKATNAEYREKYRAIYEEGSLCETVYRAKPTDGAHPHITTMVPVNNSDGQVSGILCVQRPMRELKEARESYLVTIGFSTLMLAIVASVFTVLFLKETYIVPIEKISEEATRFARENSKGQDLGQISNIDEIAKLSDSIEQMETEMLQRMEELTAITAERERIGAELVLAGTIQDNSVPSVFPAFPDRKDFDIYAFMEPAKEVGGDLYNFFLIDEDHLAFVMGDVSGKGVPAALFMMVTNILISDHVKMGVSPADVLNYVNAEICKHNKADMFVTLWLGVLELSTGKIVAANAGHDDAAVLRRDGVCELFKSRHGLVVGAFPESRYRNFELQLQPGDKLFLYTDGVPEATDKDEKMFTIDRMLRVLNQAKDRDPKGVLDAVYAGVNDFVGEAPQFDDLTMLCIELKGPDKA